jgi:hypothetical protein
LAAIQPRFTAKEKRPWKEDQLVGERLGRESRPPSLGEEARDPLGVDLLDRPLAEEGDDVGAEDRAVVADRGRLAFHHRLQVGDVAIADLADAHLRAHRDLFGVDPPLHLALGLDPGQPLTATRLPLRADPPMDLAATRIPAGIPVLDAGRVGANRQ